MYMHCYIYRMGRGAAGCRKGDLKIESEHQNTSPEGIASVRANDRSCEVASSRSTMSSIVDGESFDLVDHQGKSTEPCSTAGQAPCFGESSMRESRVDYLADSADGSHESGSEDLVPQEYIQKGEKGEINEGEHNRIPENGEVVSRRGSCGVGKKKRSSQNLTCGKSKRKNSKTRDVYRSDEERNVRTSEVDLSESSHTPILEPQTKSPSDPLGCSNLHETEARSCFSRSSCSSVAQLSGSRVSQKRRVVKNREIGKMRVSSIWTKAPALKPAPNTRGIMPGTSRDETSMGEPIAGANIYNVADSANTGYICVCEPNQHNNDTRGVVSLPNTAIACDSEVREVNPDGHTVGEEDEWTDVHSSEVSEDDESSCQSTSGPRSCARSNRTVLWNRLQKARIKPSSLDRLRCINRIKKKKKKTERKTEDVQAKPEPAQKFGCTHYNRSCKLISPCCNKSFWCRFCHDTQFEEEPDAHTMDRKTLKQIECVECGEVQKCSNECEKCGIQFATYYCSICNLWDNKGEEKKIFHCDECGICRVGGRENFFHCKKCDACYGIKLQGKHVCLEAAMKNPCPVCLQYMFESTDPIMVLEKCGHTLHSQCMAMLMKCPVSLETYGCCPLCREPM